jgi:hypothetical protein
MNGLGYDTYHDVAVDEARLGLVDDGLPIGAALFDADGEGGAG